MSWQLSIFQGLQHAAVSSSKLQHHYWVLLAQASYSKDICHDRCHYSTSNITTKNLLCCFQSYYVPLNTRAPHQQFWITTKARSMYISKLSSICKYSHLLYISVEVAQFFYIDNFKTQRSLLITRKVPKTVRWVHLLKILCKTTTLSIQPIGVPLAKHNRALRGSPRTAPFTTTWLGVPRYVYLMELGRNFSWKLISNCLVFAKVIYRCSVCSVMHFSLFVFACNLLALQ